MKKVIVTAVFTVHMFDEEYEEADRELQASKGKTLPEYLAKIFTNHTEEGINRKDFPEAELVVTGRCETVEDTEPVPAPEVYPGEVYKNFRSGSLVRVIASAAFAGSGSAAVVYEGLDINNEEPVQVCKASVFHEIVSNAAGETGPRYRRMSTEELKQAVHEAIKESLNPIQTMRTVEIHGELNIPCAPEAGE